MATLVDFRLLHLESVPFFRAVDKFGINLINYTEITPGD